MGASDEQVRRRRMQLLDPIHRAYVLLPPSWLRLVVRLLIYSAGRRLIQSRRRLPSVGPRRRVPVPIWPDGSIGVRARKEAAFFAQALELMP